MTQIPVSDARSIAGLQGSSASLARLAAFVSRTNVRLGLLLLAGLVPRIVVACKLSAVCDDGYSYLHVADALQRGRFDQALEFLNLNVYPIVLMGLHALGLEWATAGKLWGVLIGTALIVPLYDWLRRMFDARIATAGAFLYAVHPKLIEYSVEPIREATFWFFFVVGLDFLWRCCEERRWWQFVLAGTALALALHTRIEGWFLLAPLAMWGLASWRRAPAARLRLVAGLLLCGAMTPLLLLVLNLTLLAHHPHWEFGRLSPFAAVASWVRPPAGHAQSKPIVAAAAAPGSPRAGTSSAAELAPLPTSQVATGTEISAPVGGALNSVPTIKTRNASHARQYAIELVRTVGVPYLLLAAIGFWTLRGRFRDLRYALLPVWSAATLIAIWVQLTHAGEMNGRYFLTLAFVDAAFVAAGCLAAMDGLRSILVRPANPFNRLVVAGLVPVCLLGFGWTQAFSTRHTSRHLEARLGKWARAHTGPIHRAVSDFQAVRPAYFASGGMPDVVKYDEFFNSEFDRDPPDLLVIDPRSFSARLLPLFLERATDLGMVPLDQRGFSSAPAKFVIYVRPRPAVAQRVIQTAATKAAELPRSAPSRN